MTHMQLRRQAMTFRLMLVLTLLWSSLGGPATTSAHKNIALPSATEAALLTPLGQAYQNEIEPNNAYTQATTLTSTNMVALGNVYPNADVDFYAFTANAGEQVYAAVMTSFSSNASADSQLQLLASDGMTVVELDDDDGTQSGLSSSIAGAVITTTGTYYLRVNHFSATSQLRPYELHFRVQNGAPTPEVEANDTAVTANPLPVGGWVSGARDPASATEQDWYSFTVNAGDTVFLSLDLDPERDDVQWNGRLGLAFFGDAGDQIVTIDDGSTGSVANPLSEALFVTIKDAGTYYAFVDSASAATGGPTATYNLSVSVHPQTDEGLACTTYTSTDVPKTIGPGAGLVSSTITIPGNPRIADIDVSIQLTHTLMADIDAHLRSPAGNDNGLFTDIGAGSTGGQTQMDTIFDDEAGAPPTFTVLKGLVYKPELAYRLAWFDGEDAGGTWTLDLRDDTTNASDGVLTNWSIRICEPPPPPACPANTTPITLFSTDFEADAGGFTHSGIQDEWQYGLPATISTTTTNPVAAINTCHSGTSCWKTDLVSTYNNSSNQDLFSPAIPLTVTGLVGPLYFSWAQRYQLENATFDHAFVDIQLVGGGSVTRLWEWLDATMTNAPGNPVTNLGASSGWSVFTKTISSSYIGQNIEARFHLDSDNTVQFAGIAIDDVSIVGCMTAPNVPPTANAGPDQTINVSTTVMLDGSGSNDPDNNLPLTYDWAQSGGPTVTLSDPMVVTPTFTAPITPTVLTFTLTVTDSLGAPSLADSVVVTVTEVAISGLTASNDSPTTLGNATTLSATISAGTNATYDWDFGDGQLGGGATLTHTYGLVGTYTATVTATNSLGSVNATTLVTITAVNTPPTLNDTGNQTMTLGSPLTFTITISDAETPTASLIVTGTSTNQSIVPDANIVISGNGLTRTVTITPLITGTVTITLGVDDGNGGTASDSFDLTVQPAAPVVYKLYLPLLRH